MITFENVSKVYEDGTRAVDSINFTINKGEFFVLIGPSGCGKTTTLKMMNRLIPLSDGTIFVNGRKISDFNIHELRWDIGYVLQQIALFPHMTIEENIAIVPELKKWKKDNIYRRVTELLEMVGLDPDTYRNRKPSELSGGEQQRVGVIRALAADPEIILMDEPFSALDPLSREKLQDDIIHLQKSIKKTIIFVTHDMKETMKLADRICLMNDGKIVQLATPEELISHPSNDFVRDFVSGASWMNSDFSLEDLMEPAHHNNLSSSPSLTAHASLEEVLTLLSEHEQIRVEKNGQAIGYINRQMLIHYLSESVPVGGNNHV